MVGSINHEKLLPIHGNVLDFTDVDVLASDRRPETAWVDFFKQRKLTLVYPEASSEDEGELNLGN